MSHHRDTSCSISLLGIQILLSCTLSYPFLPLLSISSSFLFSPQVRLNLLPHVRPRWIGLESILSASITIFAFSPPQSGVCQPSPLSPQTTGWHRTANIFSSWSGTEHIMDGSVKVIILLARYPGTGPFFFIWEHLSCCQYYRFSISSLIMAPWLEKWLVGLPDMKTRVSVLCLSGHMAWVIRQAFEQYDKMFLPSPPPTSHWSRLGFILHAYSAAKSVSKRNRRSPNIYVLIPRFSQTDL